jgi:4-hydroxy-L-threonine phosphate dehydrogenase PdxA
MEKKYLITTGDPNGIGPEIILKAALKGRLSDCDVIGSFEVFKYYADKLSLVRILSFLRENVLQRAADLR